MDNIQNKKEEDIIIISHEVNYEKCKNIFHDLTWLILGKYATTTSLSVNGIIEKLNWDYSDVVIRRHLKMLRGIGLIRIKYKNAGPNGREIILEITERGFEIWDFYCQDVKK